MKKPFGAAKLFAPQALRRSMALTLGLTLLLLATHVKASIIEGMPDAIVCSVNDPTGMLRWDQLVYYVSARTVDGTTLYKTLTSDPVVLLVSAEGIIDGANLADCDQRSIQSLREEGRAFTLTPSLPRKRPAGSPRSNPESP